MANQDGYRSNPALKAGNTRIEYTKEQIEEYIKCSNDPIYFITNFVKIVNVDDGLVPFKMFDYQKRMVNDINMSRHSVVLAPRQSGKCSINQTLIKIRNKLTNEIQEISIGEFYSLCSKMIQN